MSAAINDSLLLNKVLGEKTLYLLNPRAEGLHDAVSEIAAEAGARDEISLEDSESLTRQLRAAIGRGPSEVGGATAVYHRHVEGLPAPQQVLLRFRKPLSLAGKDGFPVRYVWLLLSPTPTHPLIQAVAEFFHLMEHATFREQAMAVADANELVELYIEHLGSDVNLTVTSVSEKRREFGFLGGVKEDVRNRLQCWVDDFSCGFSIKVVAATLFMFFACAAPAVAFGALLYTLTGGTIGAIETILASAICGIIWALLGGQPFVIIGATGPNVIFTGILYTLCVQLDVPFLPTAAWVGFWSMVFLLILAAVNASLFIRFFTRFTDEIFAALISLIFISEAIQDMVRVFQDDAVPNDAALLSLLLGLGTFAIAITLSRIRRSPYLRHFIREFFSDFGPTIALVAMTVVAYQFSDIEFDTLAVPDTFQASVDRSWLVNPFEAPAWVWFASAIPALLLTILIWVNQNITSRLVNSSEHKLQKSSSYHWDIAVVGLLVGLMSLFGLPWVVGAAVRSLNHVRSLLVMRGSQIVGAIETRLSNLSVHVLMVLALFFLPLLQYVPMSVLYGMFLFMGIGSMGGNQFMERMRLWFVDPKQFHLTHHLRAVPVKIIHQFTALQFVCLTVLWLVKSSIIGILFPFFIALLVPVRMLLTRLFEPEYIALLDLEEGPEDELYREFGV